MHQMLARVAFVFSSLVDDEAKVFGAATWARITPLVQMNKRQLKHNPKLSTMLWDG